MTVYLCRVCVCVYLLQMSSPTPIDISMMRAATEITTMITTGFCSLEARATVEHTHTVRELTGLLHTHHTPHTRSHTEQRGKQKHICKKELNILIYMTLSSENVLAWPCEHTHRHTHRHRHTDTHTQTQTHTRDTETLRRR